MIRRVNNTVKLEVIGCRAFAFSMIEHAAPTSQAISIAAVHLFYADSGRIKGVSYS